jgi:tetratricopeptide (TPR) repeat protein
MTAKYDFNVLERRGQDAIKSGNYDDALRIYFFMADGDNSLDGGYVGFQLARCYEGKNDLVAARFWYGRAAEENPGIEKYLKERDRLPPIDVVDFFHTGHLL